MTSSALVANWSGIGIGSRWRRAAGPVIEVVRVQRNGVVAYRSEGSPAGEESVLDVVRFIRSFAPAEGSGNSSGGP
jgi:hypothetical protein